MSIFSVEAGAFVFVYAICTLLLVYTFKTKKTATLPQAFVYSFIGGGLMTIISLVMKLNLKEPLSEVPFYHINFVVFVGVMLTINLWLHRNKRKEVC